MVSSAQHLRKHFIVTPNFCCNDSFQFGLRFGVWGSWLLCIKFTLFRKIKFEREMNAWTGLILLSVFCNLWTISYGRLVNSSLVGLYNIDYILIIIMYFIGTCSSRWGYGTATFDVLYISKLIEVVLLLWLSLRVLWWPSRLKLKESSLLAV